MSSPSDCVPEPKLIAYLEGKLLVEDTVIVESHLHECTRCQQFVDRIKSHLLKTAPDGVEHFVTTQDFADLEQDKRAELPDSDYHAVLQMLEKSEAPESLGKLRGYEIVAVVGRGGYGIVFEAIDKVLSRRVAIKILTPDLASQAVSRRRFIREARAAAAINHPNVVTIFGVDESVPLLVMELLRGNSLRERLRREPKLDVTDILRISTQVAQGLAAAHAQGIIHRDVKPGNIMLVDDLPRVKITDFGLARVTVENVDLTSRGMAVGTPGYMSPEQVRGEELDTRSDLFALGCVIYAMFTGFSPFQGKTVLDIARRVDGFEPPRLREINKSVPDFMDAMTHRLLRKDPEKRYQSAAEVADVMNRHLALLNQTPTDRFPEALGRKVMDAPPKPRGWSWMRIAAAVAAVSLLGAGAAYWSSLDGVGSRSSTDGIRPVIGQSRSAPPIGTTPGIGEPPVRRQTTVTVAQSGNADCSTLHDALRRVAAGGTITVLDSAEYDESLQLKDADLLAGVRLVAAKQATLASKQVGPLITIQGVPRLQLIGFKLTVPQAQLGVEVRGECPGLVLADLSIQRLPNPDGTETSSAGLVLNAGAAGNPEEPIIVRRSTFSDTNVGLVIGTSQAGQAPVKHVVVEDCRIQGKSRQSSTLCALLRRCEDVTIRRNVLFNGVTGLSVVTESEAGPQNCLIEHNTWYGASNWMTWSGSVPLEMKLQIRHNLVVDSSTVSATVRALPMTDPPIFSNNAAVNIEVAGPESFAPCLTMIRDFPLLSLDPSHADFLKPDFDRVGHRTTSDPVPGCYSPPLP